MAIFQAEHGTSKSDELELLLVLIKDYFQLPADILMPTA
jgi:hypothetical protein